MLGDEEMNWIKSESNLNKREIKNKIKENFDATTRKRALSAKFIANLLNTTVANINQRVSRAKKLLKSLDYIKQLKENYKIKND